MAAGTTALVFRPSHTFHRLTLPPCSYYTPANLPKPADALAAAAVQKKEGPPRQLSPAEAIAEAQNYKVCISLSATALAFSRYIIVFFAG